MNKYQTAYVKAKAAYDAAVESKQWDLADELMEPYVVAEREMVEWMFSVVEKTGAMKKEDIKLMRDNWTSNDFIDRVVDLALRLAA